MLDFVDLTIHVTLFVPVTFWLLELVINWYLELRIEFTKESVQRIIRTFSISMDIISISWKAMSSAGYITTLKSWLLSPWDRMVVFCFSMYNSESSSEDIYSFLQGCQFLRF